MSFLTSGTGIVTALATLVAAVGGLVTAVSQFGGGGSGQPTAAPAATTSGDATTAVEGEAERVLRSHIPGSIWPTCGPPVDEEEGSVAAFNCKYRQIVGLQYNLFASSQELEAAYQDVKRRYGEAASGGGTSCDGGRFEGVYQVAGRDSGHLLCFVDASNPLAAIVWTDRDLDILSFAWRDDRNLAALFEAWQNGVGPER